MQKSHRFWGVLYPCATVTAVVRGYAAGGIFNLLAKHRLHNHEINDRSVIREQRPRVQDDT